MDARRKLRLTVDEVRREGVLGVIRKVDKSFELRGKRDFRAFNKDGFCVDLIRSETGNVMSPNERDRIGQSEDDLRGSPIRWAELGGKRPKVQRHSPRRGGLSSADRSRRSARFRSAQRCYEATGKAGFGTF